MELDPRTARSIASRYTDYALSALSLSLSHTHTHTPVSIIFKCCLVNCDTVLSQEPNRFSF